ncbi:vWA domain-containing protein [Myceligenerans pegani]|uniref:VWA domain-containing protein n=1 Tax=Myceligenerans pegani TaxID=2776917 RepID=A0ABR9MXM8_9MICO|nr:vWA domain-containing protein [Myceligenerans sp. TRM 65318]MBE1875527.1 VWA domain-containing protein [Myceligenerans sp. TRM 65318]MBE3017798.1 VWA domain-containing protein [Myceligenerans sp. TRM 65318]
MRTPRILDREPFVRYLKIVVRSVTYTVAAVMSSAFVETLSSGEFLTDPAFWLAVLVIVGPEVLIQVGQGNTARARFAQTRSAVAIVYDTHDRYVGLGVVVTPRRVLVPQHVAVRGTPPEPAAFRVAFPLIESAASPWDYQRTVRHVGGDDQEMIAALDVPRGERLPRRVLPFRLAAPSAGAAVHVFGRPAGAASWDTAVLSGRVELSDDRGVIRVILDSGTEVAENADLVGAPVVDDQTGRLLGILDTAPAPGATVLTGRSAPSFAALNVPAPRFVRMVRTVVSGVNLWTMRRVALVRAWANRNQRGLATAAVAVLTVAVTLWAASASRLLPPWLTPGPDRCVALDVSSSTEKDEIVTDLAAEFSRHRYVGLGCVDVRVHGLTSGATMEALAGDWDARMIRENVGAGQSVNPPPPDLWLPTSSLWHGLLADEPAPRFATLGPVTSSVMSVAVPESRLGTWPEVSWAAIHERAVEAGDTGVGGGDENAAGAPDDDVLLGRDNPLWSTSGLAETIAVYDAAVGATLDTPHPVTTDLLRDRRVIEWVRSLEGSSRSHGAEATLYLEDLYCGAVPPVDAVVIEEQLAFQYNQGRPAGRAAPCLGTDDPPGTDGLPGTDAPPGADDPLVALQPAEGTVRLDHPFLVRTGLGDDERRAAEAFYRFLTHEDQQDRFRAEGFRDRDDATTPTGTLRDVVRAEPARLITPPATDVVRAMRYGWEGFTKRAQVVVLVDDSPSMAGAPLEEAMATTCRIVARLSADDEVAVWSLSAGAADRPDVAPAGDGDARGLCDPDDDVPDPGWRDALPVSTGEGTALLDAIGDAHRYLGAQVPETSEDERVQAVIVITDGRDGRFSERAGTGAAVAETSTDGREPDETLDATLSALGTAERPVRVYPVAAGHEPDRCLLARIEDGTGARPSLAASGAGGIDDLMLAVFSNVGGLGSPGDLPTLRDDGTAAATQACAE